LGATVTTIPSRFQPAFPVQSQEKNRVTERKDLARDLLCASSPRFIPMTRILQSISRTVRTSSTKAVQQYSCGQMHPVVARWSKFTDAGCLA
jgi:hypothetical protein